MLRARHVRVVAFSLLLPALAGCTSIRLKTGARVPLALLPVTSMQVELAGTPALAPGQGSPLVVRFTEPDGTVESTEGAGRGRILWQDLAITSTLVSVNKRGIVSLGDDPRSSFGQTGHLDITVPTHLGLHASLDVPVRYDVGYSVQLSGINGSDGLNGTDGSDGLPGSTGSFDPDHPVAGGAGGSGGNGSNGTDGTNGGDGPTVQVRMSLMPGPAKLVQVAVSSGGNAERLLLLDPNGGSVTISSEGGRGGSGGRGGRAGRGGTGGSGSPPGSSGSDGTAGLNGSDGHSGNAGRVSVEYDPSAQPYLGLLRIDPGNGPVFAERTLGPLW